MFSQMFASLDKTDTGLLGVLSNTSHGFSKPFSFKLSKAYLYWRIIFKIYFHALFLGKHLGYTSVYYPSVKIHWMYA